ncbi:MAG: hypothetical protein ABIZ70_07410 [Gemmatimonadales bacterium]
MRGSLVLTALLLAPAVASAQQPGPARVDARGLGWQVRSDGNKEISRLAFVEMKPGWHITTGDVAGIFYRPEMTGVGAYTATMKVYFFGPPAAHPEAYGLLVGGKDLPGATQRYLYFVIRNDGKYLIKTRNGEATADVTPWTAAPAIKTIAATDTASVLNTLSVQATKDAVQFLINGIIVAAKPRKDLAVDGVVGMRINHQLNLHVADLSVVTAK